MTDRHPNESSDEYAHRLHIEMATARGAAIGAYSAVEQALARLCVILMETSKEIVGIVFFRIMSSWQRNQVIELLLKKEIWQRVRCLLAWIARPARQVKNTRLNGTHQEP
jgi:hypothetical protein